jgi:phosphodiesterase/alkaline phosphatase D-like protein
MRTLALLLLLSACGDDDGTSIRDAGVDARPMRPDAQSPCLENCTALPEVTGSGEAPREPDIDPAEFETDEATIAFAPEALTEDETTFPLGVQAGAMKPASVLLWTKVEGADPVMLRVWRAAETAGDVVLVHESMQDGAATDGYLHATVEGLAPATRYSYAFFTLAGGEPDGRSTIGRVRTAPAPGMALKTRVATATCSGSADVGQRNQTAPWPALSHMAEQDIDLTLHLGDFSYNDNEITEADYRDEWAQTIGEQGYRDLLSAAGMYATWDDHEVTDNYDPETLDATRLETAIRVYYENLPAERGPGGGLWNSYAWGDTAEFFVLDLRSERQPSTIGSGAEIFISPEQMTWLKARLMASTAHFKIVLSSVNITGMNDLWDAGVSLLDRWEGYPAQRTELLSFIDDNDIANVWFLAGDIHLGFISRLEPEGERFSNMWELTIGPSGSAGNPLGGLFENMPNAIACSFQCDMFAFVHGRRQVSTILELDPVADTIRATYTDVTTDEVLFDQLLQQER